ncbi:CRISPR-associated protein Cas4 [Mariprofundus erugo]|uniref:CRISPR-associated protein Cas4 n=1 Tax=Mariprofundus erugo TaxID=2528639 RepID=UPI0019310EF9|nr:CRISPR-associated protein Cas4 [Mariprofundus erugo]
MDDLINVSALNQYTFCPRRCGLIYIAQAWSENLHTQSGRREHEQADVPEYEIKAGVRIERALPVWSDALGLIGKCDVVEFHDDGTVYPVEYKHGRRQQWDNDDIQLCAQAICLEEMLNVTIAEGAIYHVKSRRRRVVAFNEILRGKLRETVVAVRAMVESGEIPGPVLARHCEQCSLKEICLPEMQARAIDLYEPMAEELCVRY